MENSIIVFDRTSMAIKTSNASDSFKSASTNVLLSFAAVSACCTYLFCLDGLLKAGKISSPIVLLVVAVELARWALNKFSFGLDASSRDVAISNVRSNANKVPLIANVKNVCKFSALLLIFALAYALGCILMGASYYSRFEETLVLSALLTSLTILPIALFLGPSKTLQFLFYDTFELTCGREVSHLELLQHNALGALIGAWAGTVVVPLDWDRDWQAYPIPNVIGALAGFTIANTRTLSAALFGLTLSQRISEKKAT